METKETKNCIKSYTEKPLPEVFIQGRSQDISKEGGEGHTESNRGYSPDCHVDLHAVLKKGFQRGGVWSRAPQDPLPPIYVLAFHMWVYSCEKLGLRRG